MRLSRYLQTCCMEEAKFEQCIDKLNFYHDLEERIEALLAALRPNQVIKRTTLTHQLEAAKALWREWDRKRERAYHVRATFSEKNEMPFEMPFDLDDLSVS